jgi:hypothetical protein
LPARIQGVASEGFLRIGIGWVFLRHSCWCS